MGQRDRINLHRTEPSPLTLVIENGHDEKEKKEGDGHTVYQVTCVSEDCHYFASPESF